MGRCAKFEACRPLKIGFQNNRMSPHLANQTSQDKQISATCPHCQQPNLLPDRSLNVIYECAWCAESFVLVEPDPNQPVHLWHRHDREVVPTAPAPALAKQDQKMRVWLLSIVVLMAILAIIVLSNNF